MMKPLAHVFFAIALIAFWAGNLSAQIAKAPRSYMDLLVVPTHGDWNYRTGETAELTVHAYAGGNALNNVTIVYEAGNEMMPTDTKGEALLTNGQATIRFGTMNVPGFRVCTVHFTYEGKQYREQVKVAFSPQDIRPTVEMPKDFRPFWEKVLKEASKIPAQVEVTPLPDKSTDRVVVSLVRLQCSEKGHYIYGYLSKPRKEGRYPVLMVPPGAGIKRITPINEYAEAGYITLVIEVHGLSPLADDATAKSLSAAAGEYTIRALDKPENYYYKKVYAGCIRAMDYLCSLPEFDGRNVGVCGGSQGGALTIVTAALDPRVTFLAAFYPALSDMPGFLHDRAGGWPKMFAPDVVHKLPVSTEIAARTLAYYDVVNFARMLTVPGFYSFGYNDNTCSPTSVQAVINAVTAPKEVVVTPVSAHWRFPESNEKANIWMKEQWKQ